MTTPARPSLASGVLRALRPKQWIKNLLVFAAPVAAGVIDEPAARLDTLIAFAAFCLAASGTYLLNDARDVDADRRHPTKRHRPIAAGAVPIPLAYLLAVTLLMSSLVVAFTTAADLGWTILTYLLLTTAYTLAFKHVPILDVIAVASGFILRAVAGAAATGVPISEWFFIVTSFGALFMVSGKRSGEASDLGIDAADVRATLGHYSSSYLAYLRTMSSGVVLVAYCLWAFSSAEAAPDAGLWYQLSILPFTVGILRYAMLIDQGHGAEPEHLVLSDRMLLATGALWATIYGYAVYAG
ncbi:MAG: decaprenyl-phosphate phosphoribosyltransferase [Acidimicrobiales bacterium]